MRARKIPSALYVDFNNIVAKIVGGGFGDASAAWLAWLEDGQFDPKKAQAHLPAEAGLSGRALSAFRQAAGGQWLPDHPVRRRPDHCPRSGGVGAPAAGHQGVCPAVRRQRLPASARTAGRARQGPGRHHRVRGSVRRDVSAADRDRVSRREPEGGSRLPAPLEPMATHVRLRRGRPQPACGSGTRAWCGGCGIGASDAGSEWPQTTWRRWHTRRRACRSARTPWCDISPS